MKQTKTLRVLCVAMAVVLVVSVGGLSAWDQEGDDVLKKKYAPLLGEYEFEVDGQVMLVSFWVEGGALWGGPEGQDSAELTPVEGKDMEFEINTSDGQFMEVEFVKDESGKVAKCTVLTMGMEMEGIKVKK